MNVLITGGAGYLGSVLVQHLIIRGMKVTVLDNFAHGVPSLAHLCSLNHLEIVRGDARDVTLIRRELANADVVIPLAAIVGAPACDADPLAAESTNTVAIATLCRLMSPAQRLVIPITNSGYGIGGEEMCTEASPLRPLTLYGRTKVKAEELALGRENSISLRLATVFGMSPRMRFDLLVNDFTWRAVQDHAVVLFEPHFRRNYIHVRDVAETFCFALDNFELMRGRAYNVGLTNANLTKAQLCDEIARVLPGFIWTEAEVGSDPDKRDYLVSNARLGGLGWSPQFSIADGVTEMVKGFGMFRRFAHGNI